MEMGKLVHVNLKTVDRRLLASLPSILDEHDENDAVSQSWHHRTSLQEEMVRMFEGFQGREVDKNGSPLEASAFSQQNYNLMPGMHYVDFFFGKPAQRLTLAVSLSSDLTVFPCTSDCPGSVCGSSNRISFEKSWSETWERVRCGECMTGSRCIANKCMAQGYLLGKQNMWEAYEARDYVYTGGLVGTYSKIEGTDLAVSLGFQIGFGCEVASEEFMNLISRTANGVVGLSFAKSSFIHQMFDAGMVKSSFFSMCFHRHENMTEDYTSAGTLTFGGVDPKYHITPVSYVRNTQRGGDYSVEISNIYLRKGGGVSVIPESTTQKVVKLDFDKDAFNDGIGSIIDSSSPVTLLNKEVAASFYSEWEEMTGRKYSYQHMQLTEEEVLFLPTILIQLTSSWAKNEFINPDKTPGMAGNDLDPNAPFDVVLAVPGKHYMEKAANGMYRSRLSVKNDSGSILGSNLFQGRDLVFDLVSPRIGIAESSRCIHDVGPRKTLSPVPPPTAAPFVPTTVPTAQPNTNSPTSSPSLTPTSIRVVQYRISASNVSSFDAMYLYYSGIGFIVFMALTLTLNAAYQNSRRGKPRPLVNSMHSAV